MSEAKDKIDEILFIERVRLSFDRSVEYVIGKFYRKHEEEMKRQIINNIMRDVTTEAYSEGNEYTVKFIIENRE